MGPLTGFRRMRGCVTRGKTACSRAFRRRLLARYQVILPGSPGTTEGPRRNDSCRVWYGGTRCNKERTTHAGMHAGRTAPICIAAGDACARARPLRDPLQVTFRSRSTGRESSLPAFEVRSGPEAQALIKKKIKYRASFRMNVYYPGTAF